jgi:carbonic anhydrase
MARLQDILTFNTEFVRSRQYEPFLTDRFPDKRMVILTCMDTRLIELLPKAMNLRNGDAKIIKNAGAIVSHPFGSVMRSILVAVYALKAEEILVVGHHDCGMTGLNSQAVLAEAKAAGIPQSTFDTLNHSGINLNQWLTGFDSVAEGVRQSVEMIRTHPLLPKNLPVHGLIIDPKTGKLDLLTEGSH